MNTQKITVFRTCTNESMGGAEKSVALVSSHSTSPRGFLSALKSAVAAQSSAIASFGSRAGVRVWIDVDGYSVHADQASAILAHAADDIADKDSSITSATQYLTDYQKWIGGYAE